MTQRLLIEIKDSGIGYITLNRPDVHNAFDEDLILALTEAFQLLDEDNNVRIIVLKANGKSFCAGADLTWMKGMAQYDYEENFADSLALANMFNAIHQCQTPTLASIQGSAFGGGVGLVACCDISIASEKAKFCLSEVKLGLIPATISPYVIRAVGGKTAKYFFLTADVFSAHMAKNSGLITNVVPSDSLDDEVERIAQAMLLNGPQSLIAAKCLVNDYEYQPINKALIEDSCIRIARTRVSEEGQEGITSFLEKRPPSWRRTQQ